MAKGNESPLATARKAQGLSQQALADKVGAHWITISKLERGKIKMTFEWALRLSEALDIDVFDIFQGAYVDQSVIIAEGLIINKGKVEILPEDGKQGYQVPRDFYANKTDLWLQVDGNGCRPFLHSGDLIRMTSVDVLDVRRFIGRVCLVRELNGGGGMQIGVLSIRPRRGSLMISGLDGSPSEMEAFEVLSCATMTLLSPYGWYAAESANDPNASSST